MSQGFTIRHAGSDDFAELIKLLVEMHAEIGIFSLSVERLAKRIYEVLNRGICLLAIDDDGNIVGSIGLLGESVWYSDELMLSDTWIFVRKDKRSARAFPMLVKAARLEAEQMKVRLVLCLYSLKDHDRKARLFERYARRIMTGYLFLEAGGDFLAQEG